MVNLAKMSCSVNFFNGLPLEIYIDKPARPYITDDNGSLVTLVARNAEKEGCLPHW